MWVKYTNQRVVTPHEKDRQRAVGREVEKGLWEISPLPFHHLGSESGVLRTDSGFVTYVLCILEQVS